MVTCFCSLYNIACTQELEKLRELNLQAEQEKVNAVAQVRNEAKVEIVKMRDKIQEVLGLFFILQGLVATKTVVT